MTVEILYFEGCPNSDAAFARVREAVASESAAADVRMVEVRDTDDAMARRFLGSPTIRVDGHDVETDARLRRDYGFLCRTYRTPAGTVDGAPPLQTIIEAIKNAIRRNAVAPD